MTQENGESASYWHAVRKRDNAHCIVWLQGTGTNRGVSCARTQGPVTLDDFHLLGPVAPCSMPAYFDSLD